MHKVMLELSAEQAKDLLAAMRAAKFDTRHIDRLKHAIALAPDIMYVSWHTDDIRERASDRKKRKPSIKRCRNILQQMSRRHDCNVGINWDVIDYYLDEKA